MFFVLCAILHVFNVYVFVLVFNYVYVFYVYVRVVDIASTLTSTSTLTSRAWAYDVASLRVGPVIKRMAKQELLMLK